MKRSVRTGILGVLLAAILGVVGCGGGGFSLGPSENGGGKGEIGSGPGGDNGKKPIDEPYRISVMQKIQAKMQEYLTANTLIATRNLALVEFIKVQPAVANVAVMPDGSIVTRFIDNRYFVMNDTLRAPVPVGKNRSKRGRYAAKGFSSPRMAPSGPLAPSAPIDLPKGNKAVLLNSLHPDMNQPTDELKEMLASRGYNVSVVDATIANLKTAVNDVAVLHFSTHGFNALAFGDPNKRFWGIWASDLVTPENSQNNLADLQAGRLVYFGAVNGYDWVIKQRMELHYAITPDFIKYYNWSFAENGIAFINCCYSDKGGITSSLRALPKPAKATLGWSNAAGVEPAWASARFFFDRMLGTNTEEPVEPGLQRPFNVASVYADMKRKNLAQANTDLFGPCELILAGDGIMAPSIKTMRVLERGYENPAPLTKPRLILEGNFGSLLPKSVTVGGVPVVKILSFSTTRIDCELAERPGPGFSGLVQVVANNGIKSNQVPLTQYAGVFKYTGNPMTIHVSTKGELTYSVIWRTDVHSYREECGGPLIKPVKRPFRASVSSFCSWTMNPPPPGSTWVYNGATMTFGMKGNENPPYGTGYIFEGWMNIDGSLMPIAFSFLDAVGKYQTPPHAQIFDLATPRDPKLLAVPQQVTDEQGSPVFLPSTMASLNPDYSVAAGERTGDMTASHGTKLSWSTIVPTNKPNPDEQEDVEP